MNIYIRGMAGISPGSPPLTALNPTLPITHPDSRLPDQNLPDHPTGQRLPAIEPDYKKFLDAKQIRRTSRIVRMGIAAALHCLQEAQVPMPDAIVTGTAYGCLEDTGAFLTRLIQQEEEMLSPTAFIQSTHNTVGAQIALLLQCTNYNNTFVHRGLSFESALLDAEMLLKDEEASAVLVGAIDEWTPESHAILQRFGLYRHLPAGEGAFFFLLSGRPSEQDWARLDAMATIPRPVPDAQLQSAIVHFLAQHALTIDDIQHVLYGTDHLPALLKEKNATAYKPFCGDYPTASAFALGWAASKQKDSTSPGKILILNQHLSLHYSLMLVSHAKG